MSVREDLLDVRADLTGDACAGGEERVIRRRGPVRIQPENDSGEVRVIRLRAAKLIVGLSRPERSVGQVLQLAAPADVADEDVELAIGSKCQHAAIMVPSAGGWCRLRGKRRLERAQHDQIPIERQRRSIPVVPVNPVAKQRCLGEDVGVAAGRALGPIEIDAGIAREIRVQGHTEQSALRAGVDGQIEHRGINRAIDDALHASGALLQHEQIVLADERHRGWLGETGDDGSHAEVRMQHRRAGVLRRHGNPVVEQETRQSNYHRKREKTVPVQLPIVHC